jgi:sulfate transport system permease protein
MTGSSTASRWSLRFLALGYLTILLLAPLVMIFVKTFQDGIGPPIDAVTSPDGLAALKLSLITVAVAVPLNTVFGVGCALLLVRHRTRFNWLIDGVINLPFAISPIVIGLSLYLLYGTTGWFGPALADAGIKILFSTPGIILACVFVSLPFVVREVMPVLQEIGTDQEEAAKTLGASPWQTFWKVTLPAIRWGVTYGVVLATARALGEFGAVSVVAGNISGKTQTLPLFVKTQFDNIDLAGAYAAAIVLAILAMAVLFSMNFLQKRSARSAGGDEEDHELPGPGVFVPQPVKES